MLRRYINLRFVDGTLEERRVYCQNWRGDVSVVLSSTGAMIERVKYSAYGTPFGSPAGDADSDGDTDSADYTTVSGWVTGSTWDARGDVDLDGDVDIADSTSVTSLSGTTLGRWSLSRTDTRNRKGYAGYERDPILAGDG